MSTISAGTAPGTALVTSGDTTGQLVLQTNGTTTAVTIGTNQVVSLAQPLPVASGGTGSTTGVNLATGVTGTLPIANGGTGTTSTTFVNLASNVTGTLPVANGGTGATSLTANNVLLGNGTSALQTVAPGTTGNVLTSNGTTWTSATPSTGAMVLLASINASSATNVDFENYYNSSTYQAYQFVIGPIQMGGNTSLLMRFRLGGVYYQSSEYTYNTNQGSGVNNNNIPLTGGISVISNSSYASNFNVLLFNGGYGLSLGPIVNAIYQAAYFDTSTNYRTVAGSGCLWGINDTLDGVRFTTGTGTTINGAFRLYGIKKS